MIHSKKELREYLEADRIALGRKSRRPGLFDWEWKFERCLRRREYYLNCRSLINILLGVFNAVRFQHLSLKCDFSIPPNVFGKGLSIAHRGTIVVNSHSRIGDNCRIHTGVNIGTAPGAPDLTPTIGNGCYLAPGCKIYGKIVLGNNIIVGANAVVTHSFDQDNICLAGIPAQKISDKGRDEIELRGRDTSCNNGID